MPNQSPKKVLVAGSTGLVGSCFLDNCRKNFSITTIGRQNTDKIVNLMSRSDVLRTIEESIAQAVINFAAFTNVDGAEKEKNNRDGEVYTINTLLPSWLAEACKSSGKVLYHISTDYVFDGKREDKPYTEKDTP
ncbi:sugar nucleotide-binding protein, partial [Candidatus Daviesbacteria bacterium]|nr:sugar nucleotide-binding protein [Candidatus Daviesbacteria bacterium]